MILTFLFSVQTVLYCAKLATSASLKVRNKSTIKMINIIGPDNNL